eukprot:jgi/Chrzof1/14902/Cz09g20030.t1
MADAQGTRHFGSDDVQLWQMITNVASAAYVYGEPTVSVWGRVFTTCDKQSTVTVAAAGYAVAYLYLQGGIVTRGTTTVLEASVQQSGCSGIANVLDAAAAILSQWYKDTSVFKRTLTTYSAKVGACVPSGSYKFRPAFRPGKPLWTTDAGLGLIDRLLINSEVPAPAPNSGWWNCYGQCGPIPSPLGR